MQTLDINSVNLWQILISLLNLFIIFLILKKFLYGPVKKIVAQREEEVNQRYDDAKKAQEIADQNRAEWEEKRKNAQTEADEILQSAAANAKGRSEKILAEAEEKASGILRQAEQDAVLERKKAADGIRREIVSVSGALTEKMLEREINTEDHRALIDSFLDKIGDGNE